MSAVTATRPRTPEQVIEQIALMRLGVDLDGTPPDLGEAKRLANLRAALMDSFEAGRAFDLVMTPQERDVEQARLCREWLDGQDF